MENNIGQRNLEQMKRILAGNINEEDLTIIEDEKKNEAEIGKKIERWSGDAEKTVDGKNGGTWHDTQDNY